MAEYIEREATMEQYNRHSDYIAWSILNGIEDIPSADVAPVLHGRWEMNSDRPDNIICTNCDVGFDVWKHEVKDFNYCPNCGAKMDGGNE